MEAKPHLANGCEPDNRECGERRKQQLCSHLFPTIDDSTGHQPNYAFTARKPSHTSRSRTHLRSIRKRLSTSATTTSPSRSPSGASMTAQKSKIFKSPDKLTSKAFGFLKSSSLTNQERYSSRPTPVIQAYSSSSPCSLAGNLLRMNLVMGYISNSTLSRLGKTYRDFPTTISSPAQFLICGGNCDRILSLSALRNTMPRFAFIEFL